MKRIYPYLQGNLLRLRVAAGGKTIRAVNLTPGKMILIEGGPRSGKTRCLKKSMEKLKAQKGVSTVFIDGQENMTSWLKDVNLPIPATGTERVRQTARHIPEGFYFFLDQAEAVTPAKLEVVLGLMDKARAVMVAASSFGQLHPRLKARCREARIITLGAGADTFDVTYLLIAVIIIVVAMLGYYQIVFLAAAIRYLFQGLKIGGSKL